MALMDLPKTSASWLKPAWEHIDGLYEDYVNAREKNDPSPLSLASVEAAKDFLSKVQEALQPQIAPTPNSEITLKWAIDKHKYKVWINKVGKIDYYLDGQPSSGELFIKALVSASSLVTH